MAKGKGADLAFSICFCNHEDHSQIESRFRNRIYSYHLAMKSQPLPELLTEMRTELAQARKAGVKISWSESGSKWVNTIATRSILIGHDVAPYAPTGAKRKQLEDGNASMTLLFDFVDAMESSLKRGGKRRHQAGAAKAHIWHFLIGTRPRSPFLRIT